MATGMPTGTYVPTPGHPRDTPPVAALTTIFTPPASCLNTLIVEYYRQDYPPNDFGNTHLTLGLAEMSECFPESYSEVYKYSNVGYYSPAVCPSGYTSACDVLHVSTNGFLWGPSLLPSETAYKCCPFGYSCDLTTDNQDVCWSILSTTTTALSHELVDHHSPPSLGPVETITSLPIYVQAYAIQVRFQPSDLSILPASITTMAPVETHASPGDSTDSFFPSITSSSPEANETSLSTHHSNISTHEKIAISVSTIGGSFLILGVVLIFFLRRRLRKTSHTRHVKPQKLSWWNIMDKLLLSATLILTVVGVLGILNGKCSKPDGLTADAPVCVGGSLSVQTWLAITGVEFGLLGAFILPRLTNVLISKLVTRKLTGNGVQLATLLNSQSSAPFFTQLLSGSTSTFVFRMLTVLLGIAVSILYKFSYTQVDMNTSSAVAGSSWIDFTTRSYGHSPFTNGLIDSITGNPLATRDFQNGSEYDPYTFLVGPELNISSVPQLLNGTAYTCYPASYMKSVISTTILDTRAYEIDVTQPFNDGVRIISSQDTIGLNAIVDIYTDNRTMVAMAGYYHNNRSSTEDPESYSTVYTITQYVCAGYVSWNNSLGYQDYTIESPSDVSCVLQPFDIGLWRTTPIGNFALATVNASIFSGFKNFTSVDKLWELTRNTILPTTDVEYPELKTNEWPNVLRSPVHPACVKFYDDPEFKLEPTGMTFNGVQQMQPANDSNIWNGQIVVVGLIQGAGTGMTGLGIALQGFVVFVCLLSMLVLLWAPLPLISEWPGQWMVLSSLFDKGMISERFRGVSSGKGRVDGDTHVWLGSSDINHSSDGDRRLQYEERSGPPRLVLGEEKSAILRGVGHV